MIFAPVRLVVLALLAAAGPLAAQGTPPPEGNGRHVLVVTGLSGEPAYATRFHRATTALLDAFEGRYRIPRARIRWLAEKPDLAPGRITGRSARDNVLAAIDAVAAEAKEGDIVFLLLIGHGSLTGNEARFNLPGPDVTPADLAARLSRLSRQTVVVVNAASASGAFLQPLSAPGRIIITATKTGMERNETSFVYPFMEALSDSAGAADGDKDGAVSLLEAFRFAKAEVARSFESEKRLLTEHALLDDDGDGKGSEDPALDAVGGDGAVARRVTLGPSRAVAGAGSDTVVARLVREQRAIQRQIDALRARKGSLPAAEYEPQLEALLVRLAEIGAEIRSRTGGSR